MTKRIIDGQEIPGIAKLLDARAPHDLRQSVSVIGPVGRCRRAGRSCQERSSTAGNQKNASLSSGDVLYRERRSRVRYVDDSVHLIGVDPLIGNRRRNIGFILVVAKDDFDWT